MSEKFVPILALTQFTGDNPGDLPLDSYVNAYGEGSGVINVHNGVLSVTWPGFAGAGSMEIQPGSWVASNGQVISEEDVQTGYVRLSDLGGLL